MNDAVERELEELLALGQLALELAEGPPLSPGVGRAVIASTNQYKRRMIPSNHGFRPDHKAFTDLREQRAAFVTDLALGELTHVQIADKRGRGVFAIQQFSSRNSPEIVLRRRELHGDLSAQTTALWVSDKARIKALYQ